MHTELHCNGGGGGGHMIVIYLKILFLHMPQLNNILNM